MLRTLFLVPHEIAGLPVFGFGWLLLLLAIAFAVRLAWSGKAPGGSVSKTFKQEGVLWGIAAAVVVFVMPAVELTNVQGEPVGIAVRGYGAMLVIGVFTAVAAAAYRARQSGLDPETIFALAPWTFVGGILGARLFYVIQYRENYLAATWGETISNMLAFTSGGLVVYGGFLGGFAASAFYLWRNRLPLMKLGDVIVPCIFIGLMFGRLGCLMNGCCYGGRCEPGTTSIEFPAGSAVYQDQLISGELIGMKIDDKTRNVVGIQPNGLAEKEGIRTGQSVEQIQLDRSFLQSAPKDIPADQARAGLVASVDGKIYRWSPEQLPERALPVRAAQVISSLTGAVMAVTLWLLGAWLHRRTWNRAGTLMLIGFAGYAVLRFILELVRVDEAGQFGTGFSISQWVSMLVFAASLVGLFQLYRGRPPKTLVEPRPLSAS